MGPCIVTSHTVTANCRYKRQVAVTVRQIPDAVDTGVCALDDGWWYHPKHVEQFPDTINCVNVTSCWIYIRIYYSRT
jgi:hypothetical protein